MLKASIMATLLVATAVSSALAQVNPPSNTGRPDQQTTGGDPTFYPGGPAGQPQSALRMQRSAPSTTGIGGGFVGGGMGFAPSGGGGGTGSNPSDGGALAPGL